MITENNNKIQINDEENEARLYLDSLLTKGNMIPCDEDVDTYDIHLPPWYDKKLFKRGQKYFKANCWAMFLGKFCGLLAVLAIPSILKILIHSKNSSTPKSAYRRYIATVFHTINWYRFKLEPGTDSWKSMTAVRRRHVRMSKFCGKSGQVGYITQKDMALTQFGFMGFIVNKAAKLGVQYNEKDEAGFIHFWRVVGYMIGIEDRFNVCTSSILETKKRLQVIEREQFRPLLENEPSMFYEMADALNSGLWSFNPFLDTDAFIYFTKRLAGCQGYYYFKSEIDEDGVRPIKLSSIPETIKQNGFEGESSGDGSVKKEANIFTNFLSTLGWYSRCILFLTILIHQFALRIFVFRWYFNGQHMMSRFLITYFPFLAFHRFGFRDSYVRLFRGDDIK